MNFEISLILSVSDVSEPLGFVPFEKKTENMSGLSVQDLKSPIGQLGHFIYGEHVQGVGDLFEKRCPATGRVVNMVASATRDEVEAAVQSARRALTGPWANISVQERAAVLRRIAQEINRRFDDFLQAEIQDTGKPVSMASHLDIPRGAANFNMFADVIVGVPTEAFEMATPDGEGAINYALRRPRGVIAVVCPWNLPFLLTTWKVAPALACGNTVVIKPSEETPATAILLGEVMNAAGVPPGVLNVVNGFGPDSAGEYLTSNPGVDGITFTGETVTGEVIARAAAKGVRPVSLELGGKNAAIICKDADLDKAADAMARAVFLNAGQVCLGAERIYVARDVFDDFAERLVARGKALKVGDPLAKETTLGPLISEEHRNKVLGYYKAAVADGAEVLLGGGIPEMAPEFEGGYWVEPTVWAGLPDTASVVTEEIFGPCCHLAPFDDLDEVVEKANDTPYGLAASLWTQDVTTAHKIAARLETGVVWVNSWFLRDLRTAFGGAKRSGIGREGGVHGLEFYSELKNVCVKL